MSVIKKKIAVIGTGISGLGAASLLYPHHDITVYEKNDYIGGHSRTIEIKTDEGVIPVDTGFIVFNKRNYPLLTRLFDSLDVPIVESNMSFGASINNGWLEYGTQSLTDMFSQKKNWLRPAFWRMVADILKFNKNAKSYLLKDSSYTLEDCLNDLKMGSWFRQYFLLAMGGAIWSMSLDEMLRFPATTFIRFFDNHGLLTINDHPQWYTVRGGSREYVQRLIKPFYDCIHVNRGVTSLWRDGEGVVVEDNKGEQNRYDDVVLACHADQALAMIRDVTDDEQKILSRFRYQPNRAILHTDTSFMPQERKAWASWVYLSQSCEDKSPVVSLSYWMNNLQPLPTKTPVIVTLNPGHEPAPEKVYNDYVFDHPVFDSEAVAYQHKIDTIQGAHRLWFCGAYQRYGFHEDGLGSAVKMVQKMGIHPPW